MSIRLQGEWNLSEMCFHVHLCNDEMYEKSVIHKKAFLNFCPSVKTKTIAITARLIRMILEEDVGKERTPYCCLLDHSQSYGKFLNLSIQMLIFLERSARRY